MCTLHVNKYIFRTLHIMSNVYDTQVASDNKAPKLQMPRCSSMYASMQLADA